jgi:hypothetical protein
LALPAATVTATPAAAAASIAAISALPAQPELAQPPPRLSDATADAPAETARAASSHSTTNSMPATITDV